MNFFEQQEKARRRTFFLLIAYALAVLATIFSVYIAARLSAYLFMLWGVSRSDAYVNVSDLPFQFWDPQFFIVVTGIVSGVVLVGTFFQIMSFSSGGAAVAEMLGGERIKPDTNHPDERRVLNVVEEMSIASGVPVPPVFMLRSEYGINAFAAGFSIQDAVIGVTEGTVKLLSRDELQGVIAHEYSHIFNGDMRLNMNLTGFLHGLLLIALTGKIILRGLGRGGMRSRGRGGAALLVIMLLGVLLMVIGYIGVFFCNWIKSAVSCEREFLADASSAQYTRNPSGLAGALKKIGGLSDGSFITIPKAEELSHFYFADGIHFGAEGFFPTHPPLGLRIKSLDPSFDGKIPAITSINPKEPYEYRPKRVAPDIRPKIKEWERKAAIFQIPVAAMTQGSLAETVVAAVGTLSEAHLNQANQILSRMPQSLRDAAMTLKGSMALVYGFLIDRMNMEVKAKQMEYLSSRVDPAVHQIFLQLLPDFSNLAPEFYLPLLDLATPALKTQSPKLYDVFRQDIENLITADSVVTVVEFALKQVVLHHLDYYFGKAKKPIPLYTKLEPLLPSSSILLSYLASAGHAFRLQAEAAFMKSGKELAPSYVWKFIASESLVSQNAEAALKEIAAAFPTIKEKFLKACVSCVEHDGRLEAREMELLRAFGSILDCPIPPFTNTAFLKAA